ncbi:response regulator [Cyclobacterium jeungdonense]|uniref:Response regulator n=1 Tax=Cyclobacterium jeungdonense TaxID=708087 RepID=A0ABT8C3R6_9BACT|nr:response regulator [Cyclobacterium jeungdonense]MDN3687413.1 response regulator [Cyclobacterium jeungdonense]
MEKITGKILLVDDQPYEELLLKEALASIDRFTDVEYIADPKEALIHLKENRDEIFLIISDINMPGMNGLEFKREIEKDRYLREKSIPFVFFSSDASNKTVKKAYSHSVQGYFKKAETIEAQGELLKIIFKYWASCLHPIMGIKED